eukprot:363732-Chlamydomonas_euryale.AAC.11
MYKSSTGSLQGTRQPTGYQAAYRVQGNLRGTRQPSPTWKPIMEEHDAGAALLAHSARLLLAACVRFLPTPSLHISYTSTLCYLPAPSPPLPHPLAAFALPATFPPPTPSCWYLFLTPTPSQ